MKIKRIGLGRNETLNVGDYENISTKVWVEVDLDEEETAKQAWAKLEKLVDKLWLSRVKQQIAQVTKRRKHARDEETTIRMKELDKLVKIG